MVCRLFRRFSGPFGPGCAVLVCFAVAMQPAAAQITDGEFSTFYREMQLKRVLTLSSPGRDTLHPEDLRFLDEVYQLLDDLNRYVEQEHRLNGKGHFAFSGNETASDDLFRLEAGVGMDQGLYPYELDVSTSLQMQLKGGSFQENVSDFDISFDFHPFRPDPVERRLNIQRKLQHLQQALAAKPSDEDLTHKIRRAESKRDQPVVASGLWLENYVFAKRFSDGYLGIDHRYEIGGGVTMSFYSRAMTATGRRNRDNMTRKPSYSRHGNDLLRCLEGCDPLRNILQMSQDDLDAIARARSRFLVSNRKQYSKLKLSLLAGVFYELEQASINRTLSIDGTDTAISHTFLPTNVLRWEIRPGFVWRPQDRYKLKIYPFIKFPVESRYQTISDGVLTDVREDYFIDLYSSLDIGVDDHFSISIYYRMLYDHAPRAIILPRPDGSRLLVLGEQQRTSYGMSLNFDF